MTGAKKQLKLGVVLKGTGSHIAGWRHPTVDLEKAHSFGQYVKLSQICEEAKMDFVFLADSPSVSYQFEPLMLERIPQIYHIEPLTLLSALAPMTSRIGLVGTVSTTFSEPYNVARMFGSLDHISDGRACWNVVTTTNDAAAPNFGYETHVAKDERYTRASDFVDVVKGLWNSWEPDAFIQNPETGVFADPAKMHTLNYRSDQFAVRGPLNVPRCPQGEPVVCVAASSDYGMELAARTANMMFSAALNFETAQGFYRNVKSRMPKYGRRPDELCIVLGCSVVVGRTDAEAREKMHFLESRIDIALALRYISYLAQADLSSYPLDEPLPAFLKEDRSKSRRNIVVDAAERDGLTLRQTAIRYADGFGHLSMVGSGEAVAAEMRRWLEQEAADGFALRMPYAPQSLIDFTELVLPHLRASGHYREDYTGSMLRDHLGVPVPPYRAPEAVSKERSAVA